MARKSKKSSSLNCGGNTAKKNSPTQLEWGEIISVALRCLGNFKSAMRLIEFLKSLLEQGSNLFN